MNLISKLFIFSLLFINGCYIEARTPIFKAGELVKLKSGGATMTVRHDVYNDDYVWTNWTTNNGNSDNGFYYIEQVVKVEE